MTETILPAVDIVIVARNEEKHLGAALQSIAAQNYPRDLVKVFVVDNQSSDRTAAIAERNGSCVVPHGGTVASARNAGIACGESHLIGFLDGHCVPKPDWLSLMTTHFDDPHVGGCMGAIENVCTDVLVGELMQHSAVAEQRLIASTVSGLNSTWPWLVTGNCLLRRSAVEAAGGFNPALFRCEDTDISWRLVLLGYQLVYEGRARVTHYEETPINQYLKKHYDYGVGAAQLAHAYGLLGKRNGAGVALTKPEAQILEQLYNCGYACEDARIKSQSGAFPGTYVASRRVLDDLRQPFSWSNHLKLRISSNVVYWFPDQEQAIFATLERPQRYVFDKVAAQIVRALCKQLSREETIDSLRAQYDVEREQLAKDTDEFVATLLDAGLLCEHKE